MFICCLEICVNHLSVSRCGGGKTAVFIAVDYCLKELEAEGYVDIYSTVLHLRKFRKNMVRTLVSKQTDRWTNKEREKQVFVILHTVDQLFLCLQSFADIYCRRSVIYVESDTYGVFVASLSSISCHVILISNFSNENSCKQ